MKFQVTKTEAVELTNTQIHALAGQSRSKIMEALGIKESWARKIHDAFKAGSIVASDDTDPTPVVVEEDQDPIVVTEPAAFVPPLMPSHYAPVLALKKEKRPAKMATELVDFDKSKIDLTQARLQRAPSKTAVEVFAETGENFTAFVAKYTELKGEKTARYVRNEFLRAMIQAS